MSDASNDFNVVVEEQPIPPKPEPLPMEQAYPESESSPFMQAVGTCLMYGGMTVGAVYGLLFLAKISPFLAVGGAIGLGYLALRGNKKNVDEPAKQAKKPGLSQLQKN